MANRAHKPSLAGNKGTKWLRLPEESLVSSLVAGDDELGKRYMRASLDTQSVDRAQKLAVSLWLGVAIS